MVPRLWRARAANADDQDGDHAPQDVEAGDNVRDNDMRGVAGETSYQKAIGQLGQAERDDV